MVKSMTGFGRYEEADESKKICVEIKSVNHRYCEMSIKTSKKISFLENSIRSLLKEYIKRGKVDVFISYEEYNTSNSCIKYNKSVASDYYACLNQLCEDFNFEKSDIKASLVARFPDVITIEEETIDQDELWNSIKNCIIKAVMNFVESRQCEGENLKKDILGKLDYMKELITSIEQRSPSIVDEYREKLYAKVNELLGDTKIDQAVLATEITIFADKICVDEETVRLRSHIDAMTNCLNNNDEVGRKLDFIAQEMNREANTILSKANDISVSNTAIELKTNIEKIREQIQNLE